MLSPAEIVQMLALEESALWEVRDELRRCLSESAEEALFGSAVATVKGLVATGVVQLLFARWTMDGVERRNPTIEELSMIFATPRYWRRSSRYEDYVELHCTQAETPVDPPGSLGRRGPIGVFLDLVDEYLEDYAEPHLIDEAGDLRRRVRARLPGPLDGVSLAAAWQAKPLRWQVAAVELLCKSGRPDGVIAAGLVEPNLGCDFEARLAVGVALLRLPPADGEGLVREAFAAQRAGLWAPSHADDQEFFAVESPSPRASAAAMALLGLGTPRALALRFDIIAGGGRPMEASLPALIAALRRPVSSGFSDRYPDENLDIWAEGLNPALMNSPIPADVLEQALQPLSLYDQVKALKGLARIGRVEVADSAAARLALSSGGLMTLDLCETLLRCEDRRGADTLMNLLRESYADRSLSSDGKVARAPEEPTPSEWLHEVLGEVRSELAFEVKLQLIRLQYELEAELRNDANAKWWLARFTRSTEN